MSLQGKHVGVAFTGSFCTYEKVFAELEKLVAEDAVVQTIIFISSPSDRIIRRIKFRPSHDVCSRHGIMASADFS